MMRLKFKVFAVAVILATVVGLSLIVTTVEPLRWRAAIMLRYVGGGLGDVTLAELMKMMPPNAGYNIFRLAEGQSLVAAVQSPFDTKAGAEAGARIYKERCVTCHGADAGGGSGPALNQLSSYKHGASDWSIYRNISRGIQGAGMSAVPLASFDEYWQVVSFLKSLGTDNPHANVAGGGASVAPGALAQFSGLGYGRLLAAGSDANEWRMYSRTYNGWRLSPLKQINTGNVGKLRLRWMRQLAPSGPKVEASPIVVDGVMFISEPPNNVLALDAVTGRVLWTYKHQITEKLALCCGPVNRGVAVLDDKVYIGTLDARLVALEARTGKVVWNIQLAEPRDGYSITGAPLAVKDMIISGMAGSEFGSRGFLQAVDAKTGKTRWRFNTIPGPGEPGHDTWSGDSWRTGGGSTWVTGSFDPELNLVFWGVSNPYPDFDGSTRVGDNLYTASAIALDADTGKLKWHFQFTPHDQHDWGSSQVPVLASIQHQGVDTPIVAWANRNAFYYVLDRRDGRFITGVPFARQNWAKGLDAKGRPILTPAAQVTPGGTLTEPNWIGGTNWQSPAFNPELGLFFVHAVDSAGVFSKPKEPRKESRPYVPNMGGAATDAGDREFYVRALKIGTGEKVWEYVSTKKGRYAYSGLLATSGGLVFGAIGEKLFALDAATGRELWSTPSGGDVWQGPISYGDGGQQVIVYISGHNVIAFSL